MIKNCDLSLKSIVDGTENSFFAVGKVESIDNEIRVCYQEEGATFLLTFQGDKVRLERDGDYSLHFMLIQDCQTQGEIAINGNVGVLDIYTHAIDYNYAAEVLTARLRYDILLGGDGVQEMELLLQAKIKEKNNED